MVEAPVYMQHARSRIVIALAVLMVLFPTASAVAQQSPSLGELALKEQERRKALKLRGKLLTDQDLPQTDPRLTDVATVAPALPIARTDHTPEHPTPPQEKGEAWWRLRVAQVREEIRRGEILATALQTQIDLLTSESAARDDPYQRAKLSEERIRAISELERVTSGLSLDKKKLSDIEEEARRAGVPPGWLR